MCSRTLKNIADRILAIMGLVVAAPVFLIVAITLIIQRADVFFVQERVGLNQQIFRMIKFTTMIKGSEKHGTITIANDLRITFVGKFLRRFKLNEIPQLINILKGEMSFVGPRPLPRSEVETYYSSDDGAKIYSVKPGITGCGSMEFSNEEEHLSEVDNFKEYFAEEIMPRKAKLEIWYVDNWNIVLDLKLFFRTIFKLSKTFARYSVDRFVRRER